MPNKLSQFWLELKRRNVVRVITVYAGAAFVILELVDILSPSLGLPQWTLNLVLILLIVGFFITVIVSWIYDLQPEGGIVKTESADKAKTVDIPKSSNSWKIASYISFVVIVALLVLNIMPRANNKKEILDKSIAILPFINDSPDEENTFFINGIMEEILLNLQAIKDFMVPGRTSVEQYRDQSKSIPEIAKELNVNYIVEGSGQRYGNTVRLRIQLLESVNGRHLWGDSYELVIQSPEDIFKIQIRIAESIAAELQAVITPEEKQLIENIPTSSLTAYDYYHMGSDEENRQNIDRAEEFYREALEDDPMYANAYVGLARVYWKKNNWQTTFEEDFMDSLLILANKALAIDDKLSDAYLMRGVYYWNINEIDRAIEELDRALELNPNNGSAYMLGGSLYAQSDLVKSLQYYYKALALNRGDQLPRMLNYLGWAYLPTGFIDKSRNYYTEAFKLTKDSMQYLSRLKTCEFVNEDFPLAIEYLKKAYALDSTDFDLYGSLGEYYMMNGDYVQSLKYYKQSLEMSQSLSPRSVFSRHRIGWAYWMNGFKEEGEEFFLKQIDYCNRNLEIGRVIGSIDRNYYDLAATYAFLGEKEKAFENLRLSKEYLTVGNRWDVMYLNNDPLFDNIRDEPEFQQIVRDIEAKYQAEHKRVREWLEENDML